jgi:hypothetical protein
MRRILEVIMLASDVHETDEFVLGNMDNGFDDVRMVMSDTKVALYCSSKTYEASKSQRCTIYEMCIFEPLPFRACVNATLSRRYLFQTLIVPIVCPQ